MPPNGLLQTQHTSLPWLAANTQQITVPVAAHQTRLACPALVCASSPTPAPAVLPPTAAQLVHQAAQPLSRRTQHKAPPAASTPRTLLHLLHACRSSTPHNTCCKTARAGPGTRSRVASGCALIRSASSTLKPLQCCQPLPAAA